MIRLFQWHSVAIVLVLSTVLMLSSAQPAQAETSRMKQSQIPQINCSISAYKPSRTGDSIKAETSSVSCDAGVKQTEAVVQLQQFKGNQWVTLARDNTIDGYASVSIACSTLEKTYYRTYATGEYKSASGWHPVPHDEVEESISCE